MKLEAKARIKAAAYKESEIKEVLDLVAAEVNPVFKGKVTHEGGGGSNGKLRVDYSWQCPRTRRATSKSMTDFFLPFIEASKTKLAARGFKEVRPYHSLKDGIDLSVTMAKRLNDGSAAYVDFYKFVQDGQQDDLFVNFRADFKAARGEYRIDPWN